MWNPRSLSRTPSMQSMARSVTSSSPGSSYGESIGEEEELPLQIDLWRKPEPTIEAIELQQRRDSMSTEDSHATLALDTAQNENELDTKTPTITSKVIEFPASTVGDQPKPAGPLEQLLSSLLSKVSLIEKQQPTVMAEDYQRLVDRVSILEAEKTTWSQRHEELFALRDSDIFNLIKVRGLLADERRQHEAMRKLRDDDLHNVIELREKLAQATWARAAEREKGQSTATMKLVAKRDSKPQESDLWQAAKTAAMEQRVLELERVNEELRAQQVKPQPAVATTEGSMVGIEAMFEDSLRYREKMATKLQQLRWEKEALTKESERMEERIAKLEVMNERLQRKVALG